MKLPPKCLRNDSVENNRRNKMFGLPLITFFLAIGIPIIALILALLFVFTFDDSEKWLTIEDIIEKFKRGQ